MEQLVHVSYIGLVRNVIGCSEENVEVIRGATVGQLLAKLIAKHGPPFKQSVFKQTGDLRAMSQVCINDRDIAELCGLETKMDENENISILVGVYPPEGG